MWKHWILIIGIICGSTVAPFVYADNMDQIIPIVPTENALLVEQESLSTPLYKTVEEDATRGVAPAQQASIVQMLLLYVGIVVVTGYIIRFVFAEESGGQS